MSKIILVDQKKHGNEAYQVLETEAEFLVIRKNLNTIEVSTNTDKGMVNIELSNKELAELLSKLKDIK